MHEAPWIKTHLYPKLTPSQKPCCRTSFRYGSAPPLLSAPRRHRSPPPSEECYRTFGSTEFCNSLQAEQFAERVPEWSSSNDRKMPRSFSMVSSEIFKATHQQQAWSSDPLAISLGLSCNDLKGNLLQPTLRDLRAKSLAQHTRGRLLGNWQRSASESDYLPCVDTYDLAPSSCLYTPTHRML